MTAYADCDFYTGSYREDNAPLVPVELFGVFALKASAIINQYTFGNIGEDVPDAVRLCCCELAEALYRYNSSRASEGISTEKVGDVSVSYESSEQMRRELGQTAKGIVYAWLADTGLLHRGGCLC